MSENSQHQHHPLTGSRNLLWDVYLEIHTSWLKQSHRVVPLRQNCEEEGREGDGDIEDSVKQLGQSHLTATFVSSTEAGIFSVFEGLIWMTSPEHNTWNFTGWSSK